MFEDLHEFRTLVSIITPTYNRALFLPETIESILNQSYEDFELIILDDGSTDGSDQVIKQYTDRRISHYYHENIGETATVNKGISLSRGEIICIVNSDDPLLPGAIEEAVKIMKNNSSILAAYPDWVEIGANSEFIRYIKLKQYDIKDMLTDFNVGIGPGTFIRRSTFEQYGFRNPALKYTGDLEFWMRLALQGKILRIPKFLATHRTHQGAASVFARGKAISDELIKVVQLALDYPKLPNNLKEEKDKILANAYNIVAKYYYGDDKDLFIKNIIKSYQYSVKNIIKKYSKNIFLNLKLLVWHAAYKIVDVGVSIGILFIPILRILWGAKKSIINTASSTQKFAFYTYFSSSMPSEKSVIINRLLHNLDSKCYCIITQPSLKNDKSNFKSALFRTYFQLFIEKSVARYSTNRVFYFINLIWKSLQSGINLTKAIKNQQISALIADTDSQLGPLSACIASQLLGCSFYTYYFEDYAEQWWEDKAMYPIMKIMDKIVARLSTGLIVPNEFMYKELMHRHNKLPMIVHSPTSNIIGEQIDLSKDNKINEEIKLVFTGIIDNMSADTLKSISSAISKMKDLNIKLHLYTNQLLEEIQSDIIIDENIVVHSCISPSDFSKEQKNANILLMPFTFEKRAAGVIKTSATLKLGDYLQTGNPILAFCPYDSFLGWYFTKYECGLIVPCNDVQFIIEALNQVLNNEKLKIRLSFNAKKRATIDFDPKKAQQCFLDAIGIGI